MAKLKITSDADVVLTEVTVAQDKVNRIRVACGHWDNSVTPPVWVNATVNEVAELLKQYLRNRVIEYETAQMASQCRDNLCQEPF